MATTALQQMNVRLDAELKRSAEDVLAFMGLSATEVIRALYAKIARGAADCSEAMAVLGADGPQGSPDGSVPQQGWLIAEEFYRSIGCDLATPHMDERPWNVVYEDAMSEHFREKGLLQ